MQAGECHVHSAVLESSYLRPMKPRQIGKLILSPTIFPDAISECGRRLASESYQVATGAVSGYSA
jgi:hypothetical protein